MRTPEEGYLTARTRNNDPFPAEIVGIELPPKYFARAWTCMDALAGIDDPAAFVKSVRKLAEALSHMKPYNLSRASRVAHEKLVAMLPPETAS